MSHGCVAGRGRWKRKREAVALLEVVMSGGDAEACVVMPMVSRWRWREGCNGGIRVGQQTCILKRGSQNLFYFILVYLIIAHQVEKFESNCQRKVSRSLHKADHTHAIFSSSDAPSAK